MSNSNNADASMMEEEAKHDKLNDRKPKAETQHEDSAPKQEAAPGPSSFTPEAVQAVAAWLHCHPALIAVALFVVVGGTITSGFMAANGVATAPDRDDSYFVRDFDWIALLKDKVSDAMAEHFHMFHWTPEVDVAVDACRFDSSNDSVVAFACRHSIGSWDLNQVTDFSGVFDRERNPVAEGFNEEISEWDTSRGRTMKQMFAVNEKFNQYVENRDTWSVTETSSVFFAPEPNPHYWTFRTCTLTAT